MDETQLFRIAIVVALLGMIVLFFAARNVEINETTINKINIGQSENYVAVRGVVKSIKYTNSSTIITILQTTEIQAVAFSPNIIVQVGDEVMIKGKNSEFRGQAQIIADSIIKK